MIRLTADKNNLKVNNTELLTSGSLNVYFVQFNLSADWEGLERTVCFRINGIIPSDVEDAVLAVDSVLDEDRICVVPFAMTRFAGVSVQVGIYGVEPDTKNIILPTIWATIGTVRQGVLPSNQGDVLPPIVDPGDGEVVPPITDDEYTTPSQVVAIVQQYLKQNPIQYDTIDGKPESITNIQLKEILK